jgi:predicted TIM-barrel fold metal-dependent hydrolase
VARPNPRSRELSQHLCQTRRPRDEAHRVHVLRQRAAAVLTGPEKAWRPYIETCITAFGPQRSMFESNFPVDKGTCSYQVLWNAFKRIAAGYSADEKTALFSGAASKAYHLTV